MDDHVMQSDYLSNFSGEHDIIWNYQFSGEIAPVGPTSFEFVVPEDAPLTISPAVGTVMPGRVSRNPTILVGLCNI